MERRRSAERPRWEAARGGGREARAALEAERSNDESAAEETFPRASAAARSAPSAAARRGICGQGVCDGYQTARRFARSNRGGGQASLGVGKTAGERHAAVGLRKPQKARVRSGGASFAENRRRKSAVPHRRRRTRARRTPRRYTNRRRRAIP